MGESPGSLLPVLGKGCGVDMTEGQHLEAQPNPQDASFSGLPPGSSLNAWRPGVSCPGSCGGTFPSSSPVPLSRTIHLPLIIWF